MARLIVRAAPDARALARLCAGQTAAYLRAHPGLLAVPGGTTPGPLFDALSAADAGWRRLTISLTDERWLSPRDAASNEHLARARLLRRRARAARFLPLKTPASTPAGGVGRANARLRAAGPFTLCILGMGEDGHIASLFPGAPARRGRVAAVTAPGARGSAARMSLTLPFIASAARVLLFLRGHEKLASLRRHLAPGAPETPIRSLVQRMKAPLFVFWSP